jgi:glycosyltransferase involved in cell wall biosynthesis
VKKLSILIPVYNEKKTIIQVLDAVSKAPIEGLERELIVVDDGSVDGTREILREVDGSLYSAKIYFHEANQGKGAALRTAQGYATGDPKLLQPILEGRADVVYGSRLTGGSVTRAFKVLHLFGNKFLSLLTNILYNCTITDMETCYKVFKADIFKKVVIKSNRFDFEPEITAKVLKQKVRLFELPINYYGRDYDEGKKITWRDGFAAVWALVKFRFVD